MTTTNQTPAQNTVHKIMVPAWSDVVAYFQSPLQTSPGDFLPYMKMHTNKACMFSWSDISVLQINDQPIVIGSSRNNYYFIRSQHLLFPGQSFIEIHLKDCFIAHVQYVNNSGKTFEFKNAKVHKMWVDIKDAIGVTSTGQWKSIQEHMNDYETDN
jgi:hypothetical protein